MCCSFTSFLTLNLSSSSFNIPPAFLHSWDQFIFLTVSLPVSTLSSCMQVCVQRLLLFSPVKPVSYQHSAHLIVCYFTFSLKGVCSEPSSLVTGQASVSSTHSSFGIFLLHLLIKRLNPKSHFLTGKVWQHQNQSVSFPCCTDLKQQVAGKVVSVQKKVRVWFIPVLHFSFGNLRLIAFGKTKKVSTKYLFTVNFKVL